MWISVKTDRSKIPAQYQKLKGDFQALSGCCRGIIPCDLLKMGQSNVCVIRYGQDNNV